MIEIEKTELEEVLRKAFRGGHSGYMDLMEECVQNLVEDIQKTARERALYAKPQTHQKITMARDDEDDIYSRYHREIYYRNISSD
jgi:hypothetical protein